LRSDTFEARPLKKKTARVGRKRSQRKRATTTTTIFDGFVPDVFVCLFGSEKTGRKLALDSLNHSLSRLLQDRHDASFPQPPHACFKHTIFAEARQQHFRNFVSIRRRRRQASQSNQSKTIPLFEAINNKQL